MASAKAPFTEAHWKRTERTRVEEDWRRQAQRNALCISQTHRGFWFRADTLNRRVSWGHVNLDRARKDRVGTWGQTKQILTLPRVHVNSTETWQLSVSLPCKVRGEVEKEEGEEVHGQIDGDSGGEKPEELVPFSTKLKDCLVLSNKKYLNRCFQHSLGEQPSRLGCWCDPWSLEREKPTVMADVRGNREHLFSSGRKKKTARNLKGRGIHNCVMNVVVEEKWGYK